MERIDDNEILVPRSGSMKVAARIFARNDIRIEAGAVEQLKAACALPGVEKVFGMPDIHHGYGVPIGCVVALRDNVVPAAVGYDINCGMRLLTTPLSAEDIDAGMIARSIHRDIPLGEGKRNISLSRDDFAAVLECGVRGLFEVKHSGSRAWEFWDDNEERQLLERIEDEGSMEGIPAAVSAKAVARGREQLGTLGGGNHFIELQKVMRIYDSGLAQRFGLFEGQLVVMIHSGSRGLGHQVGEDYMRLAKSYDDSHGGGQPNNNLCFFPLQSREGQNYIGAMRAAANFAFANRHLMAVLVKHNLRHHYGDIAVHLIYDVAHNIAKHERHDGKQLWVHRKGATRAFDAKRMKGTVFADTGQPVLIPGSMGTASYLLAGIPGGSRSLFSVNHGAGRTMSRTEAAGKRGRRGKIKRDAAVSDEEFSRSMEGICLVCEDRGSIKEEAPAAYKDIDAVIETVIGAGLARAVARMKPLAVLKG